LAGFKPKRATSKIRKDNIEDVEERAKEMREEFGRMSGIREPKSVLISCFKRVPGMTSEDDQKMQVLESVLPSALHERLQKIWQNKGYEAQVLEPSDIASCCLKSENKPWLDNRKLGADYVIEGQISFVREGESKVTITIRTKRSTSSDAVPTRGLDPVVVQEGLVKFILDNWQALERRLD
jgi:predicted nuclease with TOPRIM domain